MNIKLMLPIALLSSLLLISCGGGGGGSSAQTGYTGSTAQASVTSANKDSLAVSATAGAGQAVADNAASNAIPLRPSPVSAFMLGFSRQIQHQMRTANRTANQPVEGICVPGSGSVDAVANQEGSQVTMVFTNCSVIGGNGEIVNGAVFITTTDPQTFSNITMQFVNFSVVYLGESYAINATIVCNNLSCTWTSEFTGPDGRTYRTENAVVFSTGANTYNVTATVYDPEHGFVEISASVTYGSCAGGVPESGTITFTGTAASSGSVTFNSCESFSVTVEGVPTDYLWEDILS